MSWSLENLRDRKAAENLELRIQLIVSSLERLRIDPTSEVGLYAVDHYRPVVSTGAHSADALLDWLLENDLVTLEGEQ